MSRIGKMPIPIPEGVSVEIEGNLVRVTGPKGKLEQRVAEGMNVFIEDGKIKVTRPSEDKHYRALHGLTRTLISNMVEGVSKGFEKTLELTGVGYRATKQGKKLVLAVGYAYPVEIIPGEGLEIEVPAPNKIVVKGIDKAKVGQLAADIRRVREPEPYKGKGIKYEGEVIHRKVGKAGAGKGGGKGGKKK